MNDCEQCGNPTAAMVCPFCGFEQSTEALAARRAPIHVVKVKDGMPTTHQALDRLLNALNTATVAGAELMLVVHGYGSTGKGGEIRRAVRRRLAEWQATDRVSEVVFGEDFRLTRDWRKNHPGLEREVRGPNEGVTLVRL